VKSHDSELGARLGLAVMDAEASVGGVGFVGNNQLIVGPARVSSVDLIPTIGVYGTYALEPVLKVLESWESVVILCGRARDSRAVWDVDEQNPCGLRT
jgi:hypothetical protein